jgi:formate hydrogenlyase subunit 6/NADH:ubiquinone oxidoreductase subunit I
MAYKIDSTKCSACGSCIGECPVGAIADGETYSITVDECISCGACCDVCPVEAIVEE